MESIHPKRIWPHFSAVDGREVFCHVPHDVGGGSDGLGADRSGRLCRQSDGAPRPRGPYQQQQSALQSQTEQYQSRIASLDHDNQQMKTQLAQQQQQTKLLEDRLAAVSDQLRSATDQLAKVQNEKREVDERAKNQTAGLHRQAGVSITPNNSFLQTLPAVHYPDVPSAAMAMLFASHCLPTSFSNRAPRGFVRRR